MENYSQRDIWESNTSDSPESKNKTSQSPPKDLESKGDRTKRSSGIQTSRQRRCLSWAHRHRSSPARPLVFKNKMSLNSLLQSWHTILEELHPFLKQYNVWAECTHSKPTFFKLGNLKISGLQLTQFLSQYEHSIHLQVTKVGKW